ncbi:sugar phosphate nucleotidyltransferase [Candidatus Pelagibacter sp. HIMB1746]|uniref:sugar phosphate nucleotidyltransferase n=1 Tax=Candidatus Pelagibacter sp. HIMB1746 TaxID=3413370 RepID=UPI003F827E5A
MKKKPPIIILAGGKATRLRPITKNIPKSMVLINNKPFLYYQLKQLLRFNFEKIIISTGYKSQVIEKYIDKKFKNESISIIKDTKYCSGTGGAIKNCLKIINNDFFVIYGDSYLNINYDKVYKKFLKNKKHLLITALKNKNKYDKSNLFIKNNKILEYNKNSNKAEHIDYGVLCINKEAFKGIKNSRFDLKKIIVKQIQNSNVSFFEAKRRFYEIGNKISLKEFKKYAKKKL